jgi:hypothetical protein
MREPIAEPARGVVGGSRLGRCCPGVPIRRTGLSDRVGRDGRAGVLIALPKERPAGDSGRIRPVVKLGGASEEAPVGEGKSGIGGVGGTCEEPVECRLLARARGTNMPDNGCAVVKYRTLGIHSQ